MDKAINPPTVDEMETRWSGFDQAWGALWEKMFSHFTRIEGAGVFSDEACALGDEVMEIMEAVLHFHDKDRNHMLVFGYEMGYEDRCAELASKAPETPETPETPKPVDVDAELEVQVTALVRVTRDCLPEGMFTCDDGLYELTDEGRAWFMQEACHVTDFGPYDFTVEDVDLPWGTDGDFLPHPF